MADTEWALIVTLLATTAGQFTIDDTLSNVLLPFLFGVGVGFVLGEILLPWIVDHWTNIVRWMHRHVR